MMNQVNAMPTEAAAVFGAVMTVYFMVLIVMVVLQVVASWKLFEKAGEQGWKALIPVYSSYILYKIAWDTKAFWLVLGLGVFSALVSWIPVAGAVLSAIIGIALIVIELLCYVRLSRAFGHGGGYAAGLILLTPIFMMILGFDKSEYLGPQE